jgi:MFS superfamily sulfate permease-like transporter
MTAMLAPVPDIDGAGHRPPHSAAPDVQDAAWLTATVRPAGMFGYADAGRLRTLLDALSRCASIVVLDLEAAQLCSAAAAAAVDDAARHLEESGGCLMCVNADPTSRVHLSTAGHHTVLMPSSTP